MSYPKPLDSPHVQIGRKLPVSMTSTSGSPLASTSQRVNAAANQAFSEIATVFGVNVRLSIRNHTVRPFWLSNQTATAHAATMIQKLVQDAALRNRVSNGQFFQSVSEFMDLDTGDIKTDRDATAAATAFLKRLELQQDRLIIKDDDGRVTQEINFPEERIHANTKWKDVLPTLTSAFTEAERKPLPTDEALGAAWQVNSIANRLFEEVSQRWSDQPAASLSFVPSQSDSVDSFHSHLDAGHETRLNWSPFPLPLRAQSTPPHMDRALSRPEDESPSTPRGTRSRPASVDLGNSTRQLNRRLASSFDDGRGTTPSKFTDSSSPAPGANNSTSTQ